MQIKTLKDVIKFVNEYWDIVMISRMPRETYMDIFFNKEDFPWMYDDTLTSTGDYE